MVRLVGFQKPIRRGRPQSVRMAVVSHEAGVATCNCGWVFVHNRDKVREAAMQRHVDKKHDSQAMWL